MHIKTDMINVLCICVSCNFWSRIAWFPWPWIRTMKWHFRQWNFSFSFPSESCLPWFSKHLPYTYIFFFGRSSLLSPQIHRWCTDSWGLQTALSVCLLITAPPCGHCRRVGLLKVFKSELFETKQMMFVFTKQHTWKLISGKGSSTFKR